jgi:NAD-dependent deacetylase
VSIFDEKLTAAVELLNQAVSVGAFTGAGISTESGITDFRSPGGVWDRYRIVTYQEFVSSHEARVEYWTMRKELYKELKKARPNRAHKALANLENAGKLKCLITQNIDGLHQDAGNSRVIELHGTNRRAACLNCGRSWPIQTIQAILDAGELDPSCDICGGHIKPATVSFGQAMPENEIIRSAECASNCDLFLMIGSSLQVEPAASMPRVAYQAGAKLVFINRTETPWDSIASIIFRENAGEVLSKIVEMIEK